MESLCLPLRNHYVASDRFDPTGALKQASSYHLCHMLSKRKVMQPEQLLSEKVGAGDEREADVLLSQNIIWFLRDFQRNACRS
jgi:hypothetical protein